MSDPLSANQLSLRIDTLLRADDFGLSHWNVTTAAPITFTYQFESAPRSDYPFKNTSGYTGWNSSDEEALRIGLSHFEEILNIEFREVSGQADPDFSFYRADFLGADWIAGIGAWSFRGNAWDSAAIFRSDLDLSQADRMSLILHELGHAFGLKHPGDYGDGDPGPFLSEAEDNDKYTVMSYNTNPDTGLPSRNLMLYDIAALQAFWGANMRTRTGDDVYTGPNDGRLQVVWDAGGIDIISQTEARDAVIDLRAGTFSSLGSSDDFAIAYGVTIENASGNSGDDLLIGNGVSNTLTALGGDDTLYGGAGNDTLVGGAGADVIDGGSGEDWIRFASSAGGVKVDLLAGTGSNVGSSGGLLSGLGSLFGSGSRTGDAAGDTYTGIEHVFGSSHGDEIIGDGRANTLDGYDGDDTLSGGDGDDLLIGGNGADSMDGGAGFDTVSFTGSGGGVTIGFHREGSGAAAAGDTISGIERIIGSGYGDTLIGALSGTVTLDGGTGNDVLYDYGADGVLYGGAHYDVLVGGDGDDLLYGGDGVDSLFGGAGADLIHGGAGNDTASYRDSTTDLVMSLTSLRGTAGDAAGDRYVSIENLIGGSGNDRIAGDGGFNQLFGSEGADTIEGGGGNDHLYGGRDDGAVDVFIFNGRNWGRDLILDFEDGTDLIDLRGTGLTLANFTEVDSPQGVRLDYFNGSSIQAIHLFGTNAAGENLSPDDIDFSDFLV